MQVIPRGAAESEFRAGDQRGSRLRGSPGSRQTEGQGWTCLQSKMGQYSRNLGEKAETSYQERFSSSLKTFSLERLKKSGGKSIYI